MTREDIIRMAREAGALVGVKSLMNCDGDSIVFVPEELDRFVELVAAAEREECAKLCVQTAWEGFSDGMGCADAIRARGNHD